METNVMTETTLAPPLFYAGELTKLRPVLEADLPAVVALFNAAPFPFGDQKPWTLARLKKKFDDEKKDEEKKDK